MVTLSKKAKDYCILKLGYFDENVARAYMAGFADSLREFEKGEAKRKELDYGNSFHTQKMYREN